MAIGVAFLLIGATWLLIAAHAGANGDDDEHPTFTVDNDRVQCPLAQYTTIQGAVDAAALLPGAQSIRVCPGTYPEDVFIGPLNSLEIFGSGTGNTFVTGFGGTPGPIFDVVQAGFVSIRWLTVDGMSALVGGVVWGIRYDETDGTIEHVVVKNIRDPTGVSQGLCIRIQSSGAETDVKVRDTLTTNCTRVNIIANGIGVEAVIEGNRLIGPVAPKEWAPNGIQISRGAIARVENNKVSDMTSPVPDNGAGSGIILFCAGTTKVRANYVSGSDLGIAVSDNSGATVTKNRVENSVFDAYSLQFIGTLFGPLGCPTFPSPTEHNVLSDNRARNSGEHGVSLANFDPTDPAPPSENTISKNDIQGSGSDGIHVYDGTDNLFVKNHIRTSGTVDSSAEDAEDDTTGSGTAGTANTWRANRCKTSDPDGLCRKDGDERDDDWHTFGTAEGAKDPEGSGNDVVAIDTKDPETFGAATREFSSNVAALTGHLSVDYYIQAIKVDPVLPGGPSLVIERGCGGGPPRFELAIDLNGDGLFDGNAIGYVGPPPTFTGCPQNTWTHQDLTDDALRWNLLEFGGLPLNTWADVVAFFEAYPNHRVQGGTLVDDSALLPALGGLDYYDNVEIGDQTLTHAP